MRKEALSLGVLCVALVSGFARRQTGDLNSLLDQSRREVLAGNFDVARANLDEALNISSQADDRGYFRALCRAYLIMLDVATKQSDDEKRQMSELQDFEQTAADKGGVGHILWQLGWNYFDLANKEAKPELFERSLMAFGRSRRQFRAISAPVQVADCSVAMALVQNSLHRREDSIQSVREALQTYAQAPTDVDERWGFMNLFPLDPGGDSYLPLLQDASKLVGNFKERQNGATVYAFARWYTWALANRGDTKQAIDVGELFQHPIIAKASPQDAAEFLNMQAYWAIRPSLFAVAYRYAQLALPLALKANSADEERRAYWTVTMCYGLSHREYAKFVDATARTYGPEAGVTLYERANFESDPVKKRELYERSIQAFGTDPSRIYAFRDLAKTYWPEEKAFEAALLRGNRRADSGTWKLDYYLAMNRISVGDWKAAKAYIDSTLPRVGEIDGYWYIHTRAAAGFVDETLGHFDEALARYSEALKGLQASESLLGGQVNTRIANRTTESDFLRGPTRIYLEMGRTEDALYASENMKASTLTNVIRDALPKIDFAALSHDEQYSLAAAKKALDNASNAFFFGRSSAFKDREDDLIQANRDYSALLDYEAFLHPAQASLPVLDYPAKKTFGEVASDQCYLSFTIVEPTLDRFRWQGWTRHKSYFNAKPYIAVCCYDGATKKTAGQVLPVTGQQIKELVLKLKRGCLVPGGKVDVPSKRLYALLFKPVERALRGKKTLIISPDGILWQIPFGVLQDGSGQMLGLKYDIDLTPNIAIYHATRTTRSLANSPALIFADPSFNDSRRFGDNPKVSGQREKESAEVPAESSVDDSSAVPLKVVQTAVQACILARGSRLEDLPGTQQEAKAIQSDLPGSLVLTGRAAQERAFRTLAPRFSILHLASHGVFNDAAPMLSSVVLADPATAEDDGFLTAGEIASMNLHAELVVLSACNTGRGLFLGGEGQVGLAWALTAAGAKAKILAQWAVDDKATAELMSLFYKNIAQGCPPEDSLRLAQRAIVAKARYKHPYFWGAFQVYR